MTYSEQSLELIDSMVEMNIITRARGATSGQLMRALDYHDESYFRNSLNELIGGGIIWKSLPNNISDVATYHINLPSYQSFVRSLDPDSDETAMPSKTDWLRVKDEVLKLEPLIEDADLTQADRAQAGAIIESLKILVEAPDPPKTVIRKLLFDLAAIATILAAAATIASLIS